MQIGILSYNCSCCNSPVKIPVEKINPITISAVYKKMYNAKHCLNCHTEKHIPETAEAIKIFLCGL